MSYSDTWIVFDNDLNKLLDAIKRNYVLCRMAVSQRGAGANMSVDVQSGDCIGDEVYRTFYATGNVTIAAADVTNPRKDLVCVKTDGTLVSSGTDANCKGTAEAAVPAGQTGPVTTSPKPPNIPAGYLLLAEVWVPANATEIVDANITDRRILAPQKFPWNLGGLKDYSEVYSCPCILKGGYLIMRYNKEFRVATTFPAGRVHTALKYTAHTLRRGFGTYQFKWYIENKEAGEGCSVGLAWGGLCTWGCVSIYYAKDGEKGVNTSWNAGVTTTPIAVWDPTAETVIKWEWTPSSVKFYTGGALRATHNTNVPQEELPWTSEIERDAKDTDYTNDTWNYLKDWERIA